MKIDSKSVSVKGYAKINLHLDITGREENGYHSVETVMQTISLCDDVTVTLTDNGFFAECDKAGVPTDSRNLAVKAAMLFAERVGYSGGAAIKIKKNIPMAAGMAGGSADAAATLVAMNTLLGEPFSIPRLCRLGSELGADVPFCVVGGTAFADGRGDLLHEFPKMPNISIVAACGGEGVSTPWGFGLLDDIYGGFGENSGYIPRGIADIRAALERNNDIDALAKALYNIFEEPVLNERPVAKMIKETMISFGAAGAMMSGSGPSVFGLFVKEETAKRCAEAICKMGYFADTCKPVERS